MERCKIQAAYKEELNKAIQSSYKQKVQETTIIEEASTESSIPSPRIIFRWCKSILCKTEPVYLVLKSLHKTKFELVWQSDNRWFQSAPVGLPCGLHYGYLCIKDKVALTNASDLKAKTSAYYTSLFNPLQIRERQYKIDPFHVSPHRYSIELFISSNEDQPDNQFFHSSSKLDHNENECQFFKTTNCDSSNELKNIESSNLNINKNNISNNKNLENINHKQSCLNKFEIVDNATYPFTSTPNHLPKPISSCNEGRLLKSQGYIINDSNTLSNSHRTGSYLPKFVNSSILQSGSSFITTPRKNIGLSEAEKIIIETSAKDHFESISNFRKESSQWQVNAIKFNADSQLRKIEDLLESSDSEDEISPTRNVRKKNKPYGCLITFESRSASMDDLGNSQAFEDVLVSLTSSDGVQNDSSNTKNDASVIGKSSSQGHTNEKVKNIKVTESANTKCLGEVITTFSLEHQNDSETSGSILIEENDISSTMEFRTNEAEFYLNEDENFQYDSLKHDEECIPIDVRNIDSEDSLDASTCVTKNKPPNITFKQPEILSLDDENSIDIMADSYSKKSKEQKTISILKNTDKYSDECSLSAISTIVVDSNSGEDNRETENEQTVRYSNVFTNHSSKKVLNENFPENSSSNLITTGTQTNRNSNSFQKNHSKSLNFSHSPLPDKLSAPWQNQNLSNRVRNSPFYKSDLSILKRNLYSLVNNANVLNNIHSNYKYNSKNEPSSNYNKYKRASPNLSKSVAYSSYLDEHSRNLKKRLNWSKPQNTVSFHKESNYSHSENSLKKKSMYSSLPDLKSTSNVYDFNRSYLDENRKYMSSKLCSPPFLEKEKTFVASNWKSEHWSSGSSSDSTDSLIEAAELMSTRTSSHRRKKSKRGVSKSWNSSQNDLHADYSSSYTKANKTKPSYYQNLKRTRSETDLSHTTPKYEASFYDSPYLPYRDCQLSVGQLVKVLIPGRDNGVAVGRVIYIPQNGREVSIVLINESNRKIGNIYSIPIEKILLAWPKSSFSSSTSIV